MPGIDPETGTFALPLWAVAAAAALFVVVSIKAFTRLGIGTLGPVMRSLIVVAGVIVVAWLVVDRASLHNRDDERRVLEARAADLTVRAIEQGSALACLDGLAGETVEAACEKAIFADPETVAAAVSYVSARLALLGEMATFAKVRNSALEKAMAVLRRSFERDRFGIVAHVLSVRDGCTAQHCDALALLRDPSHVRTNLSAHLLDQYLDHYVAEWANPPGAPVADANAPAKPKVSANVDFPSAASIPAVSIMSPEPTGPVLPGVAAAAAANPNPPTTISPTPTRRTHKQAAAPSPPPAPPTTASVQPGPPVGAATTGPVVVPPVQLVPFPPPEANAGLATRAQ